MRSIFRLAAAFLIASLAGSATARAQQLQAIDPSTFASVNFVGDATNNAIRVNVVAGSAGGPTTTDNGSIAGGSSVNIGAALAYVWGGSNWGRWTGAVTATGNVASGATDSGNPVKFGGVYNSTPPTFTNGQRGDAQLDAAGNLKVNVAAGSAANAAASATGSAVPASAGYTGLNVGGTLRGWNGLSLGSVFAGTVAIVDASGNQVTSFGGSGGTASNIASAVPSQGTYVGFNDGTNMQGARVVDADTGAGTFYAQAVNNVFRTSGTPVEAGTSSNPWNVVFPSTPTVNVGTFPDNEPINVAQLGGTAIVTGGTNGTQAVGGIQAADAAISGNNPVLVGGFGSSSVPTAMSANGDLTRPWLTLFGATNTVPRDTAGDSLADATLDALKVTNSTAATASSYLTVRLSDGSSFLAPSADATHGSTASTSGPQLLGYGSSTAPTAVTAGQAARVWTGLNGQVATMLVDGSGSPVSVGGGTQYTHDAALTVGSTVGTMAMGRASAAAPTNVSADGDAVLPWYLRSGAGAIQPTYGGTLATTGTGAADGGTPRVAISSDSTHPIVGNVAAAATDSGNPVKVGGVYNSSAPTYTNGQRGDLQLDASGNVKVNVVAGSAANAAASATGSAVPSSADYQGVNVSGTLRGQTGVNPTGSVYAAQVDIASVGGTAATYVADQTADYDTGAGTATQVLYGIALPASGGPVAGGTSTNPIRTDPTGTTTQPVSYATTGSGTATGAVRVELANNGTGQVAAITSSVTPGTAAGNLGKAEDAAHASGDTLVGVAVRRIDTPASSAGASGDYATADAGPEGGLYTSPVATAASGAGATPHNVASAASTNATSVKASAGNLYSITLINTTATLYYLRLYNLATSPTCSSATGYVTTVPIPANAAGAGVVSPIPVGMAFTTGIAYCITGGPSSTDNTNAATGVYGFLAYK